MAVSRFYELAGEFMHNDMDKEIDCVWDIHNSVNNNQVVGITSISHSSPARKAKILAVSRSLSFLFLTITQLPYPKNTGASSQVGVFINFE